MADAADKFLTQRVDDGSITQAERDEVRLGRESSGCTPPLWVYWSVLLPKDLVDAGLTVRDCEIYSNYPGWMKKDIAVRFGITPRAVQTSLDRVRRLLPSLQNDPNGRLGLPNLSHMISLDAPDTPEPDPRRAIKF